MTYRPKSVFLLIIFLTWCPALFGERIIDIRLTDAHLEQQNWAPHIIGPIDQMENSEGRGLMNAAFALISKSYEVFLADLDDIENDAVKGEERLRKFQSNWQQGHYRLTFRDSDGTIIGQSKATQIDGNVAFRFQFSKVGKARYRSEGELEYPVSSFLFVEKDPLKPNQHFIASFLKRIRLKAKVQRNTIASGLHKFRLRNSEFAQLDQYNYEALNTDLERFFADSGLAKRPRAYKIDDLFQEEGKF